MKVLNEAIIQGALVLEIHLIWVQTVVAYISMTLFQSSSTIMGRVMQIYLHEVFVP